MCGFCEPEPEPVEEDVDYLHDRFKEKEMFGE